MELFLRKLVALDADQTAGGVLMIWDRRALEKLKVLVRHGHNAKNGVSV